MSDKEFDECLKNEGIIRNRLKVYSVRKNAIIFINIQKEFGSFDQYI
jgi:DNA-3-methyladenine glycosylase I